MATIPVFRSFRLALIQLGGVGPDKSTNLKHAHEMILKAAKGDGTPNSKPSVVVLPECFNSPYGHAHFPTYAETIGFTQGREYDVQASKSESVKMLSSAAKQAGVWLVGGSIPERSEADEKLYNTCTVYSPTGTLVTIYRKVHLFDIDIPGKITFKESETLSGGSSINFFDTDFARIGLGICYDVRFPELSMIAARRGCHVLIYPGAFNMTTGPIHWSLLQRARAVDNQIFFSMCSPARDMSAGYHAWGHSMVVDPFGKILAEADERECIINVTIESKTREEVMAGIPVSTQRRFDVYPDVERGQAGQ